MTQKEIDKFLANTKVYVNGKNKEILEKLSQFGYTLFDIQHEYEYNKDPFMYIWPDKTIGHGHDMTNFSHNDQKEITADEILSLKLTEPSYRPFNDREECWQEMLKHQPFGWLRTKKGGSAILISSVYMGKEVWIVWANGNTSSHSASKVFDGYVFADGTPFGIKED